MKFIELCYKQFHFHPGNIFSLSIFSTGNAEPISTGDFLVSPVIGVGGTELCFLKLRRRWLEFMVMGGG